ncbi:MAG: hypothetical protein WBR18_14445 [Anaerolineales bacterium]
MPARHRKLTRREAGALLALLAGAALSCSTFGSLISGTPEPAAQVATLESQLSSVGGTVTAVAAGDDDKAGVVVTDDFENGTDAFETGPTVSVTDGSLLIGPYESCANDVANFDAPVDCLSICTRCGSPLKDYELTTTLAFSEGLSEREFGVILRFVDENANGLIDRPDYLLAIGFNSYANQWTLYLHKPDQLSPWTKLRSGRAGFLTMGRLNHLTAVASENGRHMEVFLNDSRLVILTGDHPDPGERLIEPWADDGEVGLLILGRGVQARFDDFTLTTQR